MSHLRGEGLELLHRTTCVVCPTHMCVKHTCDLGHVSKFWPDATNQEFQPKLQVRRQKQEIVQWPAAGDKRLYFEISMYFLLSFSFCFFQRNRWKTEKKNIAVVFLDFRMTFKKLHLLLPSFNKKKKSNLKNPLKNKTKQKGNQSQRHLVIKIFGY